MGGDAKKFRKKSNFGPLWLFSAKLWGQISRKNHNKSDFFLLHKKVSSCIGLWTSITKSPEKSPKMGQKGPESFKPLNKVPLLLVWHKCSQKWKCSWGQQLYIRFLDQSSRSSGNGVCEFLANPQIRKIAKHPIRCRIGRWNFFILWHFALKWPQKAQNELLFFTAFGTNLAFLGPKTKTAKKCHLGTF